MARHTSNRAKTFLKIVECLQKRVKWQSKMQLFRKCDIGAVFRFPRQTRKSMAIEFGLGWLSTAHRKHEETTPLQSEIDLLVIERNYQA